MGDAEGVSRRDNRIVAPGRASLRATTRGIVLKQRSSNRPGLPGRIFPPFAEEMRLPPGRLECPRGGMYPGWSLADSLDPGLTCFDASGVCLPFRSGDDDWQPLQAVFTNSDRDSEGEARL